MKGSLTMSNNAVGEGLPQEPSPTEDLRYYLSCPLRKNHARVSVTVCHQKRCLWLATGIGAHGGAPLHCGYGDPNLIPGKRRDARRCARTGITRDGVV